MAVSHLRVVEHNPPPPSRLYFVIRARSRTARHLLPTALLTAEFMLVVSVSSLRLKGYVNNRKGSKNGIEGGGIYASTQEQI